MLAKTLQVTTTGLTLSSIVSRKPEGTGTLDITLFSVGNPVVEPRVGGPTQVVFTFNENVTLPAGSLAGSRNQRHREPAVASGNTVTVNMSGAANDQGAYDHADQRAGSGWDPDEFFGTGETNRWRHQRERDSGYCGSANNCK